MTSPSFESVVTHANVLLSAATGRAAQGVFRKADLTVVTTEAVVAEVRQYLAGLAARYGMTPERAEQRLRALPLLIHPESEYESHLEEARVHIGARDPDDVGLLALAMKLKIPIWSNDRDFANVPVEVYPTAVLLKILGS